MTHDSGKIAAHTGETNPDSWAAVALNGGTTTVSGNSTTAYAVCADISSPPTVTVQHSSTGSTTMGNFGTAHATTSGCSVNSLGDLTSGGASISGGDPTASDFAQPGSPGQGDHLTGSYPGTHGSPTTSGTPDQWTADTAAGGMGSPSGTYTDVWALCVS